MVNAVGGGNRSRPGGKERGSKEEVLHEEGKERGLRGARKRRVGLLRRGKLSRASQGLGLGLGHRRGHRGGGGLGGRATGPRQTI